MGKLFPSICHLRQQNMFRKLIFSFSEILINSMMLLNYYIKSFSSKLLMTMLLLIVIMKNITKAWQFQRIYDNILFWIIPTILTTICEDDDNEQSVIHELYNQSQPWVFGEKKKRWFISLFIALLSTGEENSFQSKVKL